MPAALRQTRIHAGWWRLRRWNARSAATVCRIELAAAVIVTDHLHNLDYRAVKVSSVDCSVVDANFHGAGRQILSRIALNGGNCNSYAYQRLAFGNPHQSSRGPLQSSTDGATMLVV